MNILILEYIYEYTYTWIYLWIYLYLNIFMNNEYTYIHILILEYTYIQECWKKRLNQKLSNMRKRHARDDPQVQARIKSANKVFKSSSQPLPQTPGTSYSYCNFSEESGNREEKKHFFPEANEAVTDSFGERRKLILSKKMSIPELIEKFPSIFSANQVSFEFYFQFLKFYWEFLKFYWEFLKFYFEFLKFYFEFLKFYFEFLKFYFEFLKFYFDFLKFYFEFLNFYF